YHKLRIWTINEDGSTQLAALGDKNIGAIFLGHVSTPFQLKDNNNQSLGEVVRSGIYLSESGQVGVVQEINLTVQGKCLRAHACRTTSTNRKRFFTLTRQQIKRESSLCRVQMLYNPHRQYSLSGKFSHADVENSNDKKSLRRRLLFVSKAG